ncbi:hypothetical protein [Salidesulfovibrio onnuriiensis]|uniref:hypothetical protein n=1 Tax=Salidesulfovibrio onnuriiensis TaxID=2583823 RepID=UPI0011CAE485|nr:hypothetical protein [Salidesulfovibrio onnuriiensis]
MARRQSKPSYFKLFLLGLALAYLATGFVDKPTPIHFEPGDSTRAAQSAVVESDVQVVQRMNVFKLGDPLTMQLLLPEFGADDDWEFKGEVAPPPVFEE